MRNKMYRHARLLSAATVALLVATAVVALSTPVDARPGPPGGGGPLCGWTALWDCTLPGGSHVTIAGTQCDIALFEAKTGASCVPI